MAERRMFAKSIVLSDAFLDMPLGARCLYISLGMYADDDGFVNGAKSIIRQCGATDKDMKLLIDKKFIIPFESGVIAIKHWKINNYVRGDRYQPTNYTDEKALLITKENGAYTLTEEVGIPEWVDPGKDRLGKDSIGKDNNKGRFAPPTLQEVKAYCIERGNNIDPESFIDFYESKGWLIGKTKMKDWKAAVRTWERNSGSKKKSRLDWIDEV